MCGSIAVFAAFTGIQSINIYVKRSGKQSVITILLVIVLTLALLSLPLKFLVLNPSDTPAEPAKPAKPAEAPKKAGAFVQSELRKNEVMQ